MVRSLVFDAGGLIALERGDRRAWGLFKLALEADELVVVPAPVVAQVWRNGTRQARLAHALRRMDEMALDGPLARIVGVLCRVSETDDVVDASVALVAGGMARSGTATVLTSDLHDMERLVEAGNIDGVSVLHV